VLCALALFSASMQNQVNHLSNTAQSPQVPIFNSALCPQNSLLPIESQLNKKFKFLSPILPSSTEGGDGQGGEDGRMGGVQIFDLILRKSQKSITQHIGNSSMTLLPQNFRTTSPASQTGPKLVQKLVTHTLSEAPSPPTH